MNVQNDIHAKSNLTKEQRRKAEEEEKKKEKKNKTRQMSPKRVGLRKATNLVPSLKKRENSNSSLNCNS